MSRLATESPGKGGVLVVAALQEVLVVEEQGAGERVAQVSGEGGRLVAGPLGTQGRLEIRGLVGAVEEAQERHEGRRTHEHALGVAQGIADEKARMVCVGRRHEVEAASERRERAHGPVYRGVGTAPPLTEGPPRNTIEPWPP